MELQLIQNKIFEVRGERVMLDFHLAELYEVETRTLKQAVKRNLDRFPEDFMFELTREEANALLDIGVSQFVIPPEYNFGVTKPFVFTEQGIAMLSTVLRSKKAIEMNIAIMRAFVLLRKMIVGYEDLYRKIERLEMDCNLQFSEIYQALTELASQKELENKPRNPIGYLKAE